MSLVFVMATYKVIQDIEAEDKFLGPLTLKQFIFGAGGLFFGWLNLFSMTRGLPWLMIIFTPPMLLGIFLAVPWSKYQPTEVWVLAKLRYYFKPRKRIWDQTGMEDLVTITAPKKEEKPLIDNLSKTEVKSRLKILAETIDSRGWAIKDAQMQNVVSPTESDERLISPNSLPHEVPIMDITTIPDVYDESAITAESFNKMIEQSTEIHKAQAQQIMDQARGGQTPDPTSSFTPPTITSLQQPATASPPMSKAEEEALSSQLKNRHDNNFATARMHKIKTLDEQSIPDNPMMAFMEPYDNSDSRDGQPVATPNPSVDNNTVSTEEHSSSILELASNNDLNVATLARQAKKQSDDDNEVVISLR